MNLTKCQQNTARVIFVIYLFLLVWLIMFKLNPNPLRVVGYRSLGLVPFSNITVINGRTDYRETLLNVVAFIPLGVYLHVFRPRWPLLRVIALCLSVSFSFEALQYIFALGATDVTDLITNTGGGIIGIALAYFLERVFGEKYVTIINNIAIAVLTLVAILIILMLLLLKRKY